MDNFKKSYAAGDKLQHQVINYYENDGYDVETSERFGRFGDWDLKITHQSTGETTLLEVKFDLQTFDKLKPTGNVCVETFKKDKYTGQKKIGGLSETKSKYYVQGYKDSTTVHKIKTETLRQLVKNYEEQTEGGDDNTIFVLIPYADFVKHCEVLFEREVKMKRVVNDAQYALIQQLLNK